MGKLLVVVILVVSLGAAAADAPRRANIVFVIADDHGQDAGCYGNPVVRTPNLDRLAKEGTRYVNAFCTTASCSASRSVILSGLHNHATGQFGHTHNYHHFSAYGSVYSLPAILADNGYRTARIGKFHVAPEEVFRFEKVLPMQGGARNPVKMAENCREFLAEKSDKPFFLYLATHDPHRSGDVRKDLAEEPNAFGNAGAKAGVEEVVYDPKRVIVPPWMPDTPAARAEIAQYYQAVSRVDQGLGRLVEILKETGQYENTLIVYTADNGSAMPGSKTTLYEPGMRLPLVVRHPAVSNRGVVSRAMVSWVDFAPTLLEVAGVKQVMAPPLRAGDPEDGPRRPARNAPAKVPYAFHGRSFLSTLEQDKPADGWDEVYASHTFHEITMYYPMRVVRTERYKLILNVAHQLPFPFASDLYESGTWQSALKAGSEAVYGKRRVSAFVQRPKYELYDLQSDPDEVKNLAEDAAHREVFEKLSVKLKAFQERTGDPWVLKYTYE